MFPRSTARSWNLRCSLLLATLLVIALPAAAARAAGMVYDLTTPPFTESEQHNGLADKPQLLADRFQYFNDDPAGQFYLVLPAPPLKPDAPAPGTAPAPNAPPAPPAPAKDRIDFTSCTIQVQLLDASGKQIEQVIHAKPTNNKAHFLLRVAGLPAGQYTMTASLLGPDGKAVTFPGADGRPVTAVSMNFARVDKKSDAVVFPADGIPVMPEAQSALADVAWPTHASVAMPMGAVDSVDRLALYDEKGQAVPADISAASTWGPGGAGGQQWVHVRFVAQYRGGQPAGYRLKLLDHPAAPAATTLSCQSNADAITVDTGVLKFVVSRKGFTGIKQAWYDPSGQEHYDDAHLVVNGDGGPYLVDGRKIRWEAGADAKATVEVEEQGPAHVIILAKGWYQNPHPNVNAPPICLFKTRIFAFAGQPLLRVQQQTILAYDSRDQRLADLGFAFVAPKAATFVMGVDGKPVSVALPAEDKTIFLHQDRYDHLRIVDTSKPNAKEAEGTHADGYFALQGPAGDMGVMLRDVWQKFPKEAEFSHTGLTLHFWPAHGHRAFKLEDELDIKNIYKFWCFEQHELLDLNLPPDYFEMLKVYPGTFECIPEHALNGNAQGLTISNEFAVLFSPPAQAAKLPAWAGSLVQQDPPANAPAAWNCATGALGPMAATDGRRFPGVEDSIEKGYLSFTRSMERGNEYGMFTYADVHTYWHPADNAADLHRVWHSSHYHEVGMGWMQYLRTGDPQMLAWVRAHTDMYINIATINFAEPPGSPDPLKFHVSGAMYHCKGLTHWGGEMYGMERRDTHAGLWGHWVDPDASLFCWYLDADPRARDVYQTWSQSIRDHGLPLKGVRREINTSLAVAVNLYRATWDADLLPAIDGMGESLRTAEPLLEQNPGPMWHPLWINRYYELTRDPAYVPFILKYARYPQIENTWTLALAGLAYDLSGDKTYLTQHFARLDRWPLQFYHASGDAYDWYGEGPGPLGMGWAEMSWGRFLLAMNHAGIADLKGGPSEPVGYPAVTSDYRSLVTRPSATIYIYQRHDQNFDLHVHLSSLGGDLHTTSVVVYSPSGKQLQYLPRVPATGGPSSFEQTLPIPASGEGVYRVEFRMYEANIFGPLTDKGAEGVVLQPNTPYRTSATISGVLLPIGRLVPVKLAIASTSDSSPCNYSVTDSHGMVVAEGSLFRPRGSSQVVVDVDPLQHPAPWQIELVGQISLTFNGGENQAALLAPTSAIVQVLALNLPVNKPATAPAPTH